MAHQHLEVAPDAVAVRWKDEPIVARVALGHVEMCTDAVGKGAYRPTTKGSQVRRSLALAADDEAGAVLDALLDAGKGPCLTGSIV